MNLSVSTSTLAPPACDVASVETLQGYLGMLNAILGVCRQANREGDLPSQAPRGEAMLARCRQHADGYLKRIDHTHSTVWEIGFGELLEGLWEALHPMPGVSEAELMRRAQKAQRMAGALEKMLSSLIVLESLSPLDVEEALDRYFGDEANGEIPF